MREIRRELDRQARAMAQHVPQDPLTVRRVLELGAAVDLEDPEAFLERCSQRGLDPVEILGFLYFEKHRRLPPSRVQLDIRHDLRWWAWFLLICGLLVAIPAFVVGDLFDSCAGVIILLVAGVCFARSGRNRLP